MIQPLLFNHRSFTTLLNAAVSNVRRSVEGLRKESFAHYTLETVINSLFAAHQIGTLSIDAAGISQQPPTDVKVPVADASIPQGNRLDSGTRFGFKVPFSGNKDLLQTTPTELLGARPFGQVSDSDITFYLEQPASSNVEDNVQAYQANLSSITAFVAALNTEVASFNEALYQTISAWVSQRKAQLDKAYTGVEAFGVPISR